jgi:hypothetical protein
VASQPGPLRLASISPSGRSVLTGRGGRLRGEVLVHNEGPEPLRLKHVELHADIGTGAPEVRLEGWQPLEIEPGVPRRAALSASVDPLTPPGSYEAEIVVDGAAQPVTLVVTEDIALTLSETEVVVIAGQERVQSMAVRNVGNVPLPVSQAGPAELAVDRPRPTLLQRLGVRSLDRPVEPTVRRRVRDDREARDREEDEEQEEAIPTVTARLKEPVVVAPGEMVVGEWVVTVEGSLDPGVRYRAVAPLYTTDISFVVTPAQEEPAAPRSSRRAPRKRKESS